MAKISLPFLSSRKVKLSTLIFGLLHALIICGEETPRMVSTHFTIRRERVTQLTVTWSPSQAVYGLWWCHGVPLIEDSQHFSPFPSSITPRWTRTPTTGIYTVKFGPNEITAGSIHPLASNMQLSDPRHWFQRLPPWKLQGLQHLWFCWWRHVQESGFHQHPGTHRDAFDGAFLADSK